MILHPDLQKHLFPGAVGHTKAIHHPLYIDPCYIDNDARAKVVNNIYLAKKEAVAVAMQKGDFQQYVALHERPYRLRALMAIKFIIMTNPAFWRMVAFVWVDSENIYQNLDNWVDLFESDRPSKDSLMDDDELRVLRQLPDEVLVYRGHSPENLEGLSWSLSKHVAEQFADRSMKGNPLVSQSAVSRDDIHAYFNVRGEQEVVISPDALDSRVCSAYKGKGMRV